MPKKRQPPVVSNTKICTVCEQTNLPFYPNKGPCADCYNKNNKAKRDARKIENGNVNTEETRSVSENEEEEFALILAETKEIRDLVLNLRDVNLLLRNENQELKEGFMQDINVLRNENRELKEMLRVQKEDIVQLINAKS